MIHPVDITRNWLELEVKKRKLMICWIVFMYLDWFHDWIPFMLINAAPELVERPSDTSLLKLKYLYSRAKELSESEVTYVQCWLLWVEIIYVWMSFFEWFSIAPLKMDYIWFISCRLWIGAASAMHCWVNSMLWCHLDHREGSQVCATN